MKPLPFVTEVNGIWTLAADVWTTPDVVKQKTLKWDATFDQCVKAIGDRKGSVIDVGAFIGDSTKWFADQHPTFTFEPQRDAFMCLCHNIPNGLHFPFPAGNGEIVGLQFSEGGNMGARRIKRDSAEMVRTFRIDDLGLDDVVFIKIDVEGWEPNVILGASETIKRCRPLVRVEFNKPALDRAGFTYADIEKHFQGWKSKEVFRYGNEQWDMLYLP